MGRMGLAHFQIEAWLFVIDRVRGTYMQCPFGAGKFWLADRID